MNLHGDSPPGFAPFHRGFAFVAIGSNLGDSIGQVRAAIARLNPLSAAPLVASSLWRTAPVDCPPGSPDFINAVVRLAPLAGETPESLLQKLHLLEKELGRQPRKILNEPRAVDLDLIAFGGLVRNSGGLTLPHPRAHRRRFVLGPLAEIAPDLILPGQESSISQLLARLPATDLAERLV